MRIITLTKIDTRLSPVQFSDTDEPGENQNVATAATPATPVAINVMAIRCYYPRRNEQPGTRITFTDGGGFPVAEPYEAVDAMVKEAYLD